MLDAVTLRCPWCGERFETLVDGSAGDGAYTEDCPVCCRPIVMRPETGADGEVHGLDGQRED